MTISLVLTNQQRRIETTISNKRSRVQASPDLAGTAFGLGARPNRDLKVFSFRPSISPKQPQGRKPAGLFCIYGLCLNATLT